MKGAAARATFPGDRASGLAGATPGGSISFGIVIACLGLFLLLAALDLIRIATWAQAVSVLGLSYAGVVQYGWLFQFLSAPFLHASLTHLGFNMLTLWMLGPSTEQALGRGRYVMLSALSAMGAMAAFLVWNWGVPVIGMGYSGVIFGLLVTQAILFPDRPLYVYAFFPLRMKHAVWLLAGMELYLTIGAGPGGVAHIGHVAGATAAWGYLRWVRSRARGSAGAKMAFRLVPSLRRTRGEDIPKEL